MDSSLFSALYLMTDILVEVKPSTAPNSEDYSGMTHTGKNICVMALAQVAGLVGAILLCAISLGIRKKLETWEGYPLPYLACLMKSYGFLLLLIPFAWTALASLSAFSQRQGGNFKTLILAAGFLLCFGIALLLMYGVFTMIGSFCPPLRPLGGA